MDNDGYPDMLIGDTANGTLRIVGVDTEGFHGGGDGNLKESIFALRNNFELVLKYESETDQYLGFHNLQFNSLEDLDLEGDGSLELVTIVAPNGEGQGMRIFDGIEHNTEWDFVFPEDRRNLTKESSRLGKN